MTHDLLEYAIGLVSCVYCAAFWLMSDAIAWRFDDPAPLPKARLIRG